MSTSQALNVGALYAEHREYLWRFLRSRYPHLSHDDLDDLVADTFERAVKAAGRWEDRGYSGRTWLCRIALHRQNDLLDARTRRPTLPLDAIEEPVTTSPYSQVELSVDLRDALACLPERQRAVIEARFWRGLMSQEIGPHGVISKLQARAIKRLRRYLKEEVA